jgi:hypothetical protein
MLKLNLFSVKEFLTTEKGCVSDCVDRLVVNVFYPHCQIQCDEGIEKSECVNKCVNAALWDGSIVNLCKEKCSNGQDEKIKDWAAVADADYWKFYFDGFKLQDKVLAFKKAISSLQKEAADDFSSAFFTNLGFYKPPSDAGYLPIPVVAPELPSYSGQF